VIARCRHLIIRSELQPPMRKTISYKMNLAWQTDDKLFMFLHEEPRFASTVVCGGCRRVHSFQWFAAYCALLISCSQWR
jgi:hypothetical protein